MNKPFEHLDRKQDLIRHFTPNWFTVNMGTGVLALILAEFGTFSSLFSQLGAGLWLFNTGLFIFFTVLYSLRWILFPQEAKQIFSHPSMSLFLGAIPMALATIINGFLKFGVEFNAELAINLAQTLWYVDVILAVAIAWTIPICMYSLQKHTLSNMSALWLLPIVACEVAASSGGLLLQHLEMGQHAVGILLGSYLLLGLSILPAFAILTILMLRLALHQLLPKELAISCWLALGPIGTGALALLVLGAQAPEVLATIAMQELGVFFHQAGILGSLILLGFGLWWLGIAVLNTLKHAKDLPFNLGWWGLTFPFAVFILAFFNLAHQTNFAALNYVAFGFASLLIMLWLVVMSKTIQGFYQGHLFFSPCLKAYLEK